MASQLEEDHEYLSDVFESDHPRCVFIDRGRASTQSSSHKNLVLFQVYQILYIVFCCKDGIGWIGALDKTINGFLKK